MVFVSVENKGAYRCLTAWGASLGQIRMEAVLRTTNHANVVPSTACGARARRAKRNTNTRLLRLTQRSELRNSCTWNPWSTQAKESRRNRITSEIHLVSYNTLPNVRLSFPNCEAGT